MHRNANATKRKRNGTVMQRNAKEMLRKRFFNANATEHKCKRKRRSTQTERELFYDRYCTRDALSK